MNKYLGMNKKILCQTFRGKHKIIPKFKVLAVIGAPE